MASTVPATSAGPWSPREFTGTVLGPAPRLSGGLTVPAALGEPDDVDAEPAERDREQDVGLEGCSRRKTEVPDQERHEQRQRDARKGATSPTGDGQEEEPEERAQEMGEQRR